MNQITKKGISLLIVLLMLVSLLPQITLTSSAATVNYVYNGNYVYNWGQRGTTATFLSPMAEAFYENEGVSYGDLSTLSGSSSTSSVPSSDLYQKLKSLMTDAHSYKTSYEATKSLYQYTDCENSGGTISSFYSGAAIGPAWGQGSWNREHTWPDSKGLGGQDENDIMMLRPTATSENSSRGNTAYGESSSYYDPNDESNGTYNLHGDVARIVLYVYVRWGNTQYMWGSSGVMESKAVLLKWMEEDPVDTWELGRNDAVQAITGTRNVFVDYPELAFDLFEEDVPADMDTPSGAGVSYTVTAQSNNTSYGTVSVSGNVITATPETGYYAKDFTVLSGSATVKQEGNTFTVSASSDCLVCINFAPKTTVTVTFFGTGISSQSGYSGEAMSLPVATDLQEYTFQGWTSSALSQDTTEKPTVYSGTFYPTANMTLYPLYSYVDENETSGTGDYVKVTTAPADWSGEYVIVYEDGGLIFDGSRTSFDGKGNYQSAEICDTTITAEAGDPYKFSIQTVNGGYAIQGVSGKYIGHDSNANGLSTFSEPAVNTISLTASGEVNIICAGGAYLRYNASTGQFRYYKSSTYSNQMPIALYRKDGSAGTTYYTTSPSSSCQHINTVSVAELPSTCEEYGYTAGVYCNDCQTYISGHEVMEPAHSFGPWEISWPATCTEQGEQARYCDVCDFEEIGILDYADHDYIDGICSVCEEEFSGNPVEHWKLILADDIGVCFEGRYVNVVTDVTLDGEPATYSFTGSEITVSVAPAQLNDEIAIYFGETVAATYTVRGYANQILADDEGQYSEKTKELVRRMLAYGGRAQAYFAHNPENLADAGILQTGDVTVPADGTTLSSSGMIDGIYFYGATLVHENKTAVRIYFSGDLSQVKATSNRYNATIGYSEKNQMYYVEIPGINPQELADTVTVTVTSDTQSIVVSYSPLTYIIRVYGNTENESLKALLKAMYGYYVSAKDYTV